MGACAPGLNRKSISSPVRELPPGQLHLYNLLTTEYISSQHHPCRHHLDLRLYMRVDMPIL
ncbi:MAG: hypothetical protein C4519_21635 [Desulfobacteraceae bacterium]|nr:MAG: hypothetical protein C4519_21635 [Desulfobacteraceae bacterium]